MMQMTSKQDFSVSLNNLIRDNFGFEHHILPIGKDGLNIKKWPLLGRKQSALMTHSVQAVRFSGLVSELSATLKDVVFRLS